MLKKLFTPHYWIIVGILGLFLIGTLWHFLYDITGEMAFIGAFTPVNESIWEHTKMVLLPVLLWWTIYFLLSKKKYHLSRNQWFTSALVAVITSITLIPLIYYFYTSAFGIESMVFDILILLVALGLGQILGLHVYKYTKGIHFLIPIILFVGLIILYIVFTFYPPHLPIFLDKETGLYGILINK